jgi:hypothetical protein
VQPPPPTGSNVDLTVLRNPASPDAPAGVSILRNFQRLNEVADLRARMTHRPASLLIPRGATVVIAETVEITAGPGRAVRSGLQTAELPLAAGGGGVSESKMDTTA